MTSWIQTAKDSDFSIFNIPFGIAQLKNSLKYFVATRIGDYVINLSEINRLGYLSHFNISQPVFDARFLNDFIALGKPVTSQVRNELINIFSDSNGNLAQNTLHQSLVMLAHHEVNMLMPVKVGNYTDFYSSIQHATNVGSMFRDPKNALLPNYRHIPIGYHGRASSITVSGTNFHRPKGQTKPADVETPVFGPCKQLDFELEMAFITGKATNLGETITTDKAGEFIFGMVLFNDWSARDIQTWEYVPLGPFLSKSFCSTISPWVVTLEALEPFRVAGEKQTPPVLPYLEFQGNLNIDIQLSVSILAEGSDQEKQVSNSNYKYMYWNMNQQLAHHSVNGCNIEIGDMYASGTISGNDPSAYGSMLEITWRGTKPIAMPDGSERKFIHDKDTVIMRAFAQTNSIRVGFGEARAKVLPAL